VRAGNLRSEALDDLALLAARLVDSRHRSAVDELLHSLPDNLTREQAGLAYARGYLEARRGSAEQAVRWLIAAQARATSAPLNSRIAAELASIYMSRGEVITCDAILTAAEGRARSSARFDDPDLLHSRALLADHTGDRRGARELYRQCLAVADLALTPFTRVVALSNLAVAISHIDPREAVALGELALTQLVAEELNDRIAPAIRNIVGYALICLARLDDARTCLSGAAATAVRDGNARIEQYARFNLAIVAELEGLFANARDGLLEVVRHAGDLGLRELGLWADLRILWLDVVTGQNIDPARSLRVQAPAATAEFQDAVDHFRVAQAAQAHRYAEARSLLQRLRERHRQSGDDLSHFVTEMWIAHAEELGGRQRAARISASSAASLGRQGKFVVSPNWWDREVVETLRRISRGSDHEFFAAVFPGGQHGPARSQPLVHLGRSGSMWIDGEELQADTWRTGRSGRRVLQRFFSLLSAKHPKAVERDELIDELWPSSDGDRALENLYAATHDLRQVLAAVPGVSLSVDGGLYALRLLENVTIAHGPASSRD